MKPRLTSNSSQDAEAGVRSYSLSHALFFGLIAAVIYYIAYEITAPNTPLPRARYGSIGGPEYIAWLIALLFPVLIFYKGADYSKVKFSFSWSFLSIISYIYVPMILLLRIPGLPRAVAILLSSLLAASFLYSADEFWRNFKASRAVGIKTPFSKRVRTALFRLDALLIVFITLGTTILVVFLLVPVVLILLNAFTPPVGEPFYANFKRVFTARKYVSLFRFATEKPWTFVTSETGYKTLVITGVNHGILLNSLINSVIVTTVATLLGVLVAFVLARYRFPGKGVIRLLAVVPLFVTPFVNSYAVRLLFGAQGPISWVTERLFGFDVEIRALAGVTIAQIMAFYPIVYLNAYAGFLGVDPTLEEQAENLGAKGFRLFRTVTLPLALPGIAAGSIIVFIFSLEDLGAPIVFQEQRLMSYKIYQTFTTEIGTTLPEAAALAFVMLALAVVGFLAIKSYVGLRSYAMVAKGGRWKSRERKLGPVGLILVYFLLLPLIIWTMMPQLTVIMMALNMTPANAFKPSLEGATLKYFLSLFKNPDVFIYVKNTVTYALTAVVFAVVISIMVAYSVSRGRIRVLSQTLDALGTIPLAIPGLVVALGYFYFFHRLFTGTALDPLSGPTTFQAWVVLITAYTIRKMPFVLRSVYAGLQQVHENLEEAAMNLGATRRRTVFGIVLPLIITYLVSGAVVGFIYVSTEVSTSITIGGLRPDQAPMTFYMMDVFQGGHLEGIQIAAAMGLLLILIQLAAILLIVVGLKQSYAFIGA
ncbi:MAG: iron ABC transporter permease [Desulfurococcales archaeon]|nr:iron ABC transporter permease [Desulfurococcales archaeon]